jgi:hypothetical protein
MKNYFKSLNTALLLILSITCCYGQKSNDRKTGSAATVNSDSTEEKIASIRKEYKRIISEEPKCKVATEDMDDRSTEGGEMKKFYLGKSLQKARLIFFGETGKAIFEYYFVEGVVIFFLKRTYGYNIPMYLKGSRVSKMEEERFYFNNKTLIRWIGPDGKIIASNRYSGREKEILQDLSETVFKK